MRRIFLTVVMMTFLPAVSFAAGKVDAPGPQVVVSLRPLHALVAGVMEGAGEPRLLISRGGSPHGYVLRPSEARLLAEADLVVWVGPELESFLVKPLAALAAGARQLEQAEVLAPRLLAAREGGGWDERHVHQHDGSPPEGDGPSGDGHESVDPHFWLDPRLAAEMVTQVAAVLAEIDPGHRQLYQQNAVRLRERLARLHGELAARLAPVRQVPYIVFHDAYQYFEAAYGLRAVGSITLDPERKPGARRIVEIRDKIVKLKARCVFSEPQFEPRLVATIIEGTGARTGTLDPLGSALPAGQEGYFSLLNDLADSLVTGLRE